MDTSDLITILGYDTNNKYHRAVRSLILILISLTMFVLTWWFLALLLKTNAIPTPDRVLDAAFYLFEHGDREAGMTIWAHMGISLKRYFGGFAIALAVAIPIGLFMGYSKMIREFISPALEVLRPIAPMAWAPVFLFATDVVLGPILVVFVGIFFPLMTNTMFGVSKIEPNLLDAAKTLGASKAQMFYKVVFPCTMPHVMNGIRVGLGIGWMCIVASEMYASYGGGIGYFVATSANLGLFPNVFVGIGIIAILGILTTSVADFIYKRIAKRTGME